MENTVSRGGWEAAGGAEWWLTSAARDGHFLSILDGLPGFVTLATPRGQLQFANRQVLEYLGATLEELKARDQGSSLHPEDRPAVLAAWRRSLESGNSFEVEARLRRADGVYRWFETRGLPLRDALGHLVLWCILQTDVDARRRAEALLAGERQVLELVALGHPLPQVCEAICRLLDSTAEGCVSCVLMLDRARATVERAIAPGLPAGFRAALEGRAVSPGAGPGILAAVEQRPVIVADVTQDGRWTAGGWSALALAHDLKSCWTSPIRSSTNESFGAFAIYRRLPGEPTPWQQELMQKLAHVAGIAIERSRDIENRRRAEALLAGENRLLELVARGSSQEVVLDVLCAIVEELAAGCFCSILVCDPEATRWQYVAAPSMAPAYNKVLHGKLVDPSYGTCSLAARLKSQIISVDVMTDPRWSSSAWPSLMQSHGLQSCWSTPILGAEERVLGVFALYQHEPGSPTELQHELIRQFTHLAGIAIERSRNQEALRQSEARKTAILNSVLDGVITIDHEGRITEFNPAAERNFGHRREDVLGRMLAEVIIPPHLREQHQRGMARYLATGQALIIGRRVEMTGLRADGTEFPLELAITRIPGEGPPSFTGYMRDITEGKRAEEALRRSAAFLAHGQRLSSTGTFAWRVTTGEVTWSDETYHLFGFEPGTPVTMARIGSRVHPDDLPMLQERIERAATEASDFAYEHRLLLPDQSVKYLHLVAQATRDHAGHLEYIGAVQDVTERRRAEEALGKARSELAHMARLTTLGALTASIAHEINQPLSGIITNASTGLRMLAADPPNVDGARETARRTIRDGLRASEVITRLRDLLSNRAPTMGAVDLNAATREVVALTEGELKRNRVVLRTELADDLPQMTGDRVQLQQVILNLLLNASDAMSAVHDRPRLVVVTTASDAGAEVRLSVQDAGTGIDPEAANRLFEAFFTTKHTGMGIGLSVSRSIIESHRGRLWADQNEGPGATFSFSIPCGAEPAPSAERTGGVGAPATAKLPTPVRTQ